MTLDEAIRRSRLTHGDRFSYLALERHPVGKSGDFPFWRLTCKAHPEVGEFLQRQDSHVRGQVACVACKLAERTGRDRHDFATVVEKCRAVHGDRFDYLRLVTEYKKPTFVVARCPEGHEFSVSVSNHLHNEAGCGVCRPFAHTFETAVAAAKKIHGERFEYTGFAKDSTGRLRLQFNCKEHGPTEQGLDFHLKSEGCGLCGRARATETNRVGQHDVFSKLLESGSSLKLVDGTYTYGTKKAQFICANGHVTDKLPALLLYNPGCRMCGTRVSKQNQEICETISGATLEQTIAPRLFIDVLLKEKRLAIEHHGLIWHSDRYRDNPRSHCEKMLKVQGLGYRYIQIFQDEWAYRRPQCIALLQRAAGQDTSPITGARRTTAQPLPSEAARAFLQQHHVQGAPNDCTNAWALTGPAGAVAVATFTQAASSRITLPMGVWEMSRFATVGRVPGGFSKLLKAAVAGLSIQHLRTFSDNRLFTGAVYALAGFQKTAELAPDYRYTNGTREARLHKSNFQKEKLLTKYPEFDGTLTERVMARQLGYYRIYDAGKVLWTLQT